MRLRTFAFVASALAGLLYVSVPSASALPGASRTDLTTAKPAAEVVRYRRGWHHGYHRRGWGGYGGYPYGYYRPYYGGYYGYRYGGYGYDYPYYYRRRPGFGIYLGF